MEAMASMLIGDWGGGHTEAARPSSRAYRWVLGSGSTQTAGWPPEPKAAMEGGLLVINSKSCTSWTVRARFAIIILKMLFLRTTTAGVSDALAGNMEILRELLLMCILKIA